MSTRESLYVFIMAGGVGSRLWPRSRTNTPKQFLDLVGPETMLQESFNRLLPIVPPERILVGVGSRYVNTVEEQLRICRLKARIGPDEPIRLMRFEVRRFT